MSIQLQDFEEFQGKDAERELKIIKNCLDYAKGDPGGLPGHQLMLVVAKLHQMVVDPSDKYIETLVREVLDRTGHDVDDLDLNDFIDMLGR